MNVDAKRIDGVLTALARAAAGDFAHPIEISENADEFLEVEAAANMLLEELASAKRQNEDNLRMIEEKNREIADRQNMALRELSTPIISIWDGILTLPVIGMVDTERAADMMDTMLERVVNDQASHVIIDITGVNVLDTRTADHFLRMAKAVRLLGSECLLTGISPPIAQTMTQLGIDTASVRTVRCLSDALAEAFRERGLEVKSMPQPRSRNAELEHGAGHGR